jgi:5-formyltetrahydrofolate cyclo-ligase
MTNDDSLAQEKAEARRRARSLRAVAADPSAGLALVGHFPEALKNAGVVAGYWPLGTEIDPRPLMAMLKERGAQLALPYMATRDASCVFRGWRLGDDMRPDAFGMLAPVESAPSVTPTLVLTPLLAFDRRGGRLGQGGGHYDRIFAELKPKGAIAVGLAFAAQEVERVPSGPLDAKLDWVVTEKEAVRC